MKKTQSDALTETATLKEALETLETYEKVIV